VISGRALPTSSTWMLVMSFPWALQGGSDGGFGKSQREGTQRRAARAYGNGSGVEVRNEGDGFPKVLEKEGAKGVMR
jgi:hypothetical protein